MARNGVRAEEQGGVDGGRGDAPAGFEQQDAQLQETAAAAAGPSGYSDPEQI